MSKTISADAMRAKLATAQSIPMAPVSPGDLSNVSGTSVIRLRVLDVKPYEHNPRVTENAKLLEIVESIRARGVDQMFAVCKRPKDAHYITAKGGCTRLLAMQMLASEKSEDAARFQYADFLNVPFKSELDLQVGHLTENLQRTDMTFWDTAKGILEMRLALTNERGGHVTTRDFAEWVKEQGFAISHAMLSDFEFAIEQFSSLPKVAREALGRNHIRDNLRPSHSLMQGVWLKHENRTKDEFLADYGNWVGLFSQPYAVADFEKHLTSCAAHALGYTPDAFASMLTAYKLDREAPLADLIAPAPPVAAAVTAATGVDGTAATAAQGMDALHQGGQDDAHIETHVGGNDGNDDLEMNFSDADAPDTTLDPALDDADLPTASGSFGAPAGLQVATGLVANPVAGRSTSGNGETNRSDVQGDLAGLSAADHAFNAVCDAVMAVANVGGIEKLVVGADLMPRGYFMELPNAGELGDSPADLAVQTWWTLANISGQTIANVQILLDAKAADGEPILPDTGPRGYRAVYGNDDLWQNALETCLGGVTLVESSLLLDVLTVPSHPLNESAEALLRAMRNYNALQGV